ncbi:unnamed protein product [Paramecium sonneborni]|uniref:OTU domain-containing protein n=1 Tax=Paramecium sonneborni TaxID=65129 RepID=A0A8S1KJB7_9CILI|nr:unnamed protein product [Paramecium sonneborni]
MNILEYIFKKFIKPNKKIISTAVILGGFYLFQQHLNLKKTKSQIIPQKDQKKKNEENQNPPNQSQTLDLIYNETVRARDVPDEYKQFVGAEQDIDFVLQEYGMGRKEVKESLQKYLKGMRRARGDGNCFYTSFCFQYLGYILNKASVQEFQDFISMVDTLPFSVIHNNIEYEQNDEMKQSFKQYCQIIRSIQENRNQNFFDLFSDPQGQFYGLSIIFLRNLAYKFCEKDDETKNLFLALELDLKQQILTWEYDCENNESVIKLLSNSLNIDIILFFIDEDNKKLDVQQYKNENQKALLEMYFIFRPGHYNIALKNQ